MRKRILTLALVVVLITAFAVPVMAATYYDEGGKTGTVYLYYDKAGSGDWVDYAFTDKYGDKYVPSVLWTDNTATVLPLDAKIYHLKDAKGQWIMDDNDYKIVAAITLTRAAYGDKLAARAQEAKAKQESGTFSWEVPTGARPPGTEDWIWSKSRWAKENWDNEKHGQSPNQGHYYGSSSNSGFVQSIGNFDFFYLKNGKSGIGQRIGDFYFYNGR